MQVGRAEMACKRRAGERGDGALEAPTEQVCGKIIGCPHELEGAPEGGADREAHEASQAKSLMNGIGCASQAKSMSVFS